MSVAVQVSPIPRGRIQTLLRDYAELTKMRVTTLIVMTAWCGFYFGALKSGVSSLSSGLLHALLGIGLVSAGTAALNEVMEYDVDARMRRTADRPLPSGRMSLMHGTIAGVLLTVGGAFYLAMAANALTGLLSLATAFVYLAAYTPLKRVHPVCTFVGAIPGAMPGVLGWVAARGRFEWGALVMFAIVFFWQFPHFYSIAWLYREDYAAGNIRMLPAIEEDGRGTGRRILLYSLGLIPISLAPTIFGMSGTVYAFGAVAMGIAYCYFGARLARVGLPMNAPLSKQRARQLLRASIIYLPLLFALMMINGVK
jgi:protoheme IX farnesyltransferase